MSDNFRVRVVAGMVMFVVSIVAIYTFDSIPFKILYAGFSAIAIIELFSFFKRKARPLNVLLVIFELLFILVSILFVGEANPIIIWYVALGVPGYDISAYLFGKAFGGKIFGASRPFPKISKNKTWEGTIMGVIMSLALVTIMYALRGFVAGEWVFLLAPPLAVVGDLFESYLKRKFKIKDSNEVVIHNKFFEKLELVVGGSNGHGGFLDRIDSVALTTTILYIIIKIVVL